MRGVLKFDQPICSTRTHEGRVQFILVVSSHYQNTTILSLNSIKSIQKARERYSAVSTSSGFSSNKDCIDIFNKNNRTSGYRVKHLAKRVIVIDLGQRHITNLQI
jgi:hypothetical protein